MSQDKKDTVLIDMSHQRSPLGLPALTIQEAVSRYNQIVEFTKLVMKTGVDYGTIPGTGSKPTLLKPGAEKLATLFGFTPRFRILDKIVDFESGLFYYHYACDLYKRDQMVASGEGSCNSREKKYRYRNIPEWKATEEEKAAAIRIENKVSSKGNPYKMYVIENQEPFDLINTIQKMGQKRALVAAVLIGANASEFFTQDLEDIVEDAQIIDVHIQDPKPRGGSPRRQQTRPIAALNTQDIYDAVVEAKLAENEFAARTALGKCSTGWETNEKAIAWMRLYRAWRDLDLASDEAAEKANKGEIPQ